MPSFSETLKVGGQDMQAYVSVPSGSGPFPAVVVIQAAGGVNEFIRGVSDKLAAEAEAIAGRIAERGPIAVRYAKEAINRGLEMPLEQALRYETDLTIILQTTEDRAEGVRAFLKKRKPKFKGR